MDMLKALSIAEFNFETFCSAQAIAIYLKKVYSEMSEAGQIWDGTGKVLETQLKNINTTLDEIDLEIDNHRMGIWYFKQIQALRSL